MEHRGNRAQAEAFSDESPPTLDPMGPPAPEEELQPMCDPPEVREAEEEPLLSEDAYSLLYTSKFGSKTSLFASFTISLQCGMLLVTFLDLFDYSPEGNDTNGNKNRMQIPPGSSTQIMIAQFLGMLITAMIMAADGDLVIGITQLIKGYDPRIRQQCPNASCLKWFVTGVLQSLSGALLLLDSFILSMQSSTVIDLSLNLTALHFVQEIDEMAFTLGEKSKLLGPQVEADCKFVKNLKGYSTPTERKRKLFRRRALIVLMTIWLLVPYFIVVAWQSDGHWMCKNLYIQFGDAYIPHMAHYSGLFKSQGNSLGDRRGQRNYYVDATGTYKLSFCDVENFWAVSEMEANECNDFFFRSKETETFDVTEAAQLNWYVSTEFTGLVQVDWLAIVCNDCNEDTCPSERGYCNEDKDSCICKEGGNGTPRVGLNCELEVECDYFALDQRTRDGLSPIAGASRILDQEYTSLILPELNDTVLFYGFPVYYPYYQSQDLIQSFIIYTGRRWVLYAIPDKKLADVVEDSGTTGNLNRSYFEYFFEELSNKDIYPTKVDALQKLTSDFEDYYPIFFSGPLNHGENSISGADPSSLAWVQASTPYNFNDTLIPATPDEGQPVPAKFLCSDCSRDGQSCLNGGKCDWNGWCVCPTYYLGFRCERVKDCVAYGGCNGFGTCNEEKRVCDCDKGSFGSLCQLGEGAQAVPDPLFCNECRVASRGHGKCEDPMVPECTCSDDGYWAFLGVNVTGVYCNETMDGVSLYDYWLFLDETESSISPGTNGSEQWPNSAIGFTGTANPGPV